MKSELQSPLCLIEECGGFYVCPHDPEGRMLGPLAGLESRYFVRTASLETAHFITPIFFNFAWIEQHHPRIFKELISRPLAERIRQQLWAEPGFPNKANLYALGIPSGGQALALDLARYLECRYAAAEKRHFPEPRDGMNYEIILRHHQIEPGSPVILVDDVCNNFSVIIGLSKSLRQLNLKPIAIACCVNRSSQTNFQAPGFPELPIIPFLHHPTEQFRQDDPPVSHLIAQGKVVWEPKQHWDELLKVMATQTTVQSAQLTC